MDIMFEIQYLLNDSSIILNDWLYDNGLKSGICYNCGRKYFPEHDSIDYCSESCYISLCCADGWH